MSTRGRILALVVVVALIAGGAAAYVFILDDSETVPDSEIEVTSVEPGTNPAASLAADDSTSLLYRSGRSLVLHGIEDAESETLREVPSNELAASPATQWVAFVAPEGSADAEARDKGLGGEGDAPPTVYVIDPSTDEDPIQLGYGVQPQWDPTGQLVAFLRPLAPLGCTGSDCASEYEVTIADPATGEQETIGEPGYYDLLDWGGSHLFLSDPENPQEILVMSIDGSTSSIEFPEARFRDVSPDGSHLITATPQGARIDALTEGALGAGEPTKIEGSLLEAAWSHDSSKVAVLLSPTDGVPARITIHEPGDAEGEPVDQTDGALGPLLWSPDNQSLAFVRTVPLTKKQSASQAAYCPVESQGGCGFLFTWERDVILLRLQ